MAFTEITTTLRAARRVAASSTFTGWSTSLLQLNHVARQQQQQQQRGLTVAVLSKWTSVNPAIHGTTSPTIPIRCMQVRFMSELPYHLVMGLPALSPTMASGTLAEWYLQQGDSFSAGDALAKIETDKASMDFEAQDDGYIAKLLVPPGTEDLPIGAPILITVEEAEHVAAFANYVSPETVAADPVAVVADPAAEPVAAVAAPSPPSPAPAKTNIEPPPTPVVAAAAPAPAPVVPTPVASPPPAPPTAAATPFAVAWGLAVQTASPLAKALATNQKAYIARYGTSGQSPILP